MHVRFLVAIAIAFAFFASLANAQSGLVSYWPGDGNANDIAGSNNGSFQGSATYAPGVVGQAFSLDGASRYVVVPDSPSLSMTGSFTLSAWIKINTNSVQQAIIEKYDVPGYNGYGLRIYAGKLTAFVCDTVNSNPWIIGSTTVSTGVWHHAAVVYDGTSIKVYLDGILDASSPTTKVPTDGTTSLKIGARGDDANTRLNGLIDEVAVFNRGLSATEIQSLLDGVDRPASPPPTESRAYIANQATNSVEVMDLATNTLIGNIPVGTHPAYIAVNSAGTRVYVTNVTSNNVSVIDAGSSTVIATVPVGNGPTGIAVTPDDTRVYIVNDRANSVFVMDSSTNQIISSISAGGNPQDIAITPDGSSAYVTSINGNCVYVIDTATNVVTNTIPIPDLPPYSDILPYGINITPDGSLAVVTDLRGAAITIINTSTNSIVTTIVLGGFNAREVDFSPDGRTAYVAVEGGGNLAVVDLVTFTITAQIHTGTSPFSIAVSADGKRAYIADYNSPSLAIVDTITGTVTAPLPVLSGRAAVALWEVPAADSTPPEIAPTIEGTLGNNGWYTGDVSVSWSVTDGESTVSSSVGCEAVNVTSDTTGTTYTCSATSGGGTATESITIKRDSTAPAITVNSPTNGSYLLNQAANVSFSCSDAMSGIASCSGTAADGSALDTSSTGAKSFTVNSTDNAGNTATTMVNYTVGYAVQALYDQTRAHKSGSTIPIKIRLIDANGVNVSSPSLLPHAISVIQVSIQASTDFGDSGNSNPDFDFRYNADLGAYIFNLQTTGMGTGSYLLNFTAGSPQPVYSVGFQIRQ